MKYIQRKDNYGNFETIDEFESHKEAKNMLKNYRLSDQSAYYYISQKPCRDWMEGYNKIVSLLHYKLKLDDKT